MIHHGWLLVCIALAALALGGCAKCSDPTPTAAPAASSAAPVQPKITMADQRRLRIDAGPYGRPRPSNPESAEIGLRLRQTVAQQCADTKCFHARCAPLCVQWLKEQDAGARARDMYLECVGSCAFPRDGGG
jgi:hypothetical protein